MKKYLPSIILLIVSEAIAIFLWLTKDNLFYLLNFSYIGGCISIGLALLVYKHPKEPRKNLGFIRYITFALALALVSGLFLAKAQT